MTIYFIATCAGCGFAFEPGSTIRTDEIPICSSCSEHGGLYAGECEACGDYAVCYDDHGRCVYCGPFPGRWRRLEVVR